MESRGAFAHQVTLTLADGTDQGAPGAAVTVALCGHWQHAGPCRWPHNSRLEGAAVQAQVGRAGQARLRTVFICRPDQEGNLRESITTALRADGRWQVLSAGPVPLSAAEEELAARLRRAPALPTSADAEGVPPAFDWRSLGKLLSDEN